MAAADSMVPVGSPGTARIGVLFLGAIMNSRNPADLVFIAFKGGIRAFDRYDGGEIWTWKPEPQKGFFKQFSASTFKTITRDGDRLIVAAPNRVWCLDPLTGGEVWTSEVDDLGGGYPIIAGNDGSQGAAAAAQTAAEQEAAAMASSG